MATMTADPEDWPLEPVVDWLLDEGRFLTSIDALAAGLGAQLLAAGAPIARMRLSVRILHPLIAAMSAIWQRDGTIAEDVRDVQGFSQDAAYVGSPLEHIARTGKPYRRRLSEGLGPDDHDVLHEIAAMGATDYLALPMRFSSGARGSITVATDRQAGFNDSDIAKLERLALVMSPIVEARVSLRLSETLADTYIGPRSGRRVLAGHIYRGDIETIRAAIWFSDIRGWSRIANERPAAEAVAIANAYFDRVDAAVRAHNGEVLKLIGDAVLAIFPVERDDAVACRAAIAAARQALVPTEASAGLEFEFGIGLHLGDVVYGNVGSETRLDFTVMGRAVNFAARIEKLTRSLGVPIVCSAELAAASGEKLRDLGAHEVAGWDEKVRVFGVEAG
jgi:adenylate cyclase